MPHFIVSNGKKKRNRHFLITRYKNIKLLLVTPFLQS